MLRRWVIAQKRCHGTDQEVDAGAKRPCDEYDGEHLGDADVIIALDDWQQLQQLVRVEQVNHAKEP